MYARANPTEDGLEFATPVTVPEGLSVGGNYDPVSYTHLRAHETVLDLVCRLLLEKKNET